MLNFKVIIDLVSSKRKRSKVLHDRSENERVPACIQSKFLLMDQQSLLFGVRYFGRPHLGCGYFVFAFY